MQIMVTISSHVHLSHWPNVGRLDIGSVSWTRFWRLVEGPAGCGDLDLLKKPMLTTGGIGWMEREQADYVINLVLEAVCEPV